MMRKYHVRCGMGENLEIASTDYLSLLVWFQMLDSFAYNGDYVTGGTYGKSNVGTISDGKQIIASPLMPSGYILLASKPADLTLANYIFGATRSIVKSYSMEMVA